MLNHGYFPHVCQSKRPLRLLDAYIADYLKEEVAAEGLVRNLPTFSDFLDVAAFSDGQIVNLSNVARECGVSSHTAKSYFRILEDTRLARWLPAYQKRPKRRVIGAPKLYFADVGIVNRLARRGELLAGSELYGKAFENWVFHELSTYLNYRERDIRLCYWRLASGVEVDFVLGDMQVALKQNQPNGRRATTSRVYAAWRRTTLASNAESSSAANPEHEKQPTASKLCPQRPSSNISGMTTLPRSHLTIDPFQGVYDAHPDICRAASHAAKRGTRKYPAPTNKGATKRHEASPCRRPRMTPFQKHTPIHEHDPDQ